jgi:hypothetical protein
MDRVRQVLDGLTHSEVAALSQEYRDKTTPKRSLETDLLGTEAEQRMRTFLDRDATSADLAEKRVLLQGGTFESASTDEATRLDEERRWLFGRFVALERAVIENRGTFAEVRDWVGNLEKDLVDQAHADAANAATAMANALTDSPPDLAAARAGLVELRRATTRIERNLATYKEATKAAFDEFVDLAVLAVTTLITAGQGSAIVMAIRTTIATVGTKAALKGPDYSLDEFLMDLRSGLGAAAGGKLVEGVLEPAAKQVAAYIGTTNLSKAFAGKVMPQLGKAGMWEAENVITTATGNIATNQDLTAGMGLEAHAESLIQEGFQAGIKGMRGGPTAGGDGANERVPGADEGPMPTSEEAGPVRTLDTGAGGTTGAEAIGAVAEGRPTIESGSPTTEAATPEPRVSMQLPEPTTSTPRTRRERVSHATEDTHPPEPRHLEVGDETAVDQRTRSQQEQARRAAAAPADQETFRATTTPDERARALAKEFAPLYDRWKTLEAPERLEALEKIVNVRLLAAGLPIVRVEFPPNDRMLDGARGGFAEKHFKIYLDEHMVRTATDAAEFAAIADFVSHEARHALQTFRGMRVAKAMGQPLSTDQYDATALVYARDANDGSRPAEDMGQNKRAIGRPEDLDPRFGEAWQIHREANSSRGRVRQRRHDRATERIRRRIMRFRRELHAASPGSPAHETAARRLAEAQAESSRLHNEYISWGHESDAWRMGSAVRAAVTEAFIERRIAGLEADLARVQEEGARHAANQRERRSDGADTTRVDDLVKKAMSRERELEQEMDLLRRQLEAIAVIRRGDVAPDSDVWPDPEDFDAAER